MYFDEAVNYLREKLGDIETVDEFGNVIPPQYTDDRLAVLLSMAMRYVQFELRIPRQHRMDISITPPHVDMSYEICDDFLELAILKALCILQTREIAGQFGSSHLDAQLGPARLRVGEASWGKMPKHLWDAISPCAKLEQLVMNWLIFDPRKTQVIYAVLPRQSSLLTVPGPNRMDSGIISSRQNDMIQ